MNTPRCAHGAAAVLRLRFDATEAHPRQLHEMHEMHEMDRATCLDIKRRLAPGS
jgi:hypothetical protein